MSAATLNLPVEALKNLLHINDLEIHLTSAWSSAAENYRPALRAALAASEGDARLNDLSRVPSIPGRGVSVSHCRLVGGWAASGSVDRLGLDLELAGRVRPELIARVASAREVESAPSPAALWTAKEAVYKCLRGAGQPAKYKDIVIDEWTAASGVEDLFSFQARHAEFVVRGCAWKLNPAVWASLC